MRRIACALALVALLGAPGRAFADDIDKARTLAQEAAELLDDKKWPEALERAQQAEALYHAPIHTSMIAQALEGMGRYAEAVATYEKLVAEPLPSSAPAPFREAQAEAKERLNALLARVPSLLVRVHGIPKEKATATVDGKPFDLEAGIAMRLDPGEHEVKVTAEGEKPFVKKVTLPDRGGVTLVEARLGKDAPAEQPEPTFTPSPEPDTKGPSRVPAVIAFGIGAVGIGVGAVTGVMFLGKLDDLKERCPEDQCALEDQEAIDDAGLLGNISTIGFGVGAAGVILGIVFLATGSSSKARVTAQAPAAARVEPWMGLGSAGVRGAF